MTKELWLLRHGKAHKDLDVSDFDRPLTKKGIQAVQKLGQWLSNQQRLPELVISSPAKRAWDTAQWVLAGLPERQAAIKPDHRLYFQDVATLKQVLAEQVGFESILLIGHNPYFEKLLNDLVRHEQTPNIGIKMSTAMLAKLSITSNWDELSSGQATLLTLIDAKQLPELT